MNKNAVIFLMLMFSFSFYYHNLNAQSENISKLKINQIMEGYDFVGNLPENLFWSSNNKSFYFEWKRDNAISDSLYRYTIDKKEISKMGFNEQWDLPTPQLVYSKDKTMALYQKNGDIYLINLTNNQRIQITNTLNNEYAPGFTEGEKKVVFTTDNNLYSWEISSGKLEQLTDFTEKTDNSDKMGPDDKEQWLQDDQLELFPVLKKRFEKEKLSKQDAEKTKIKRPLTISTKGKNITNIRISPDGNFVSYVLYKREQGKRTNVPNYVTKSGYTEEIATRPKVGSEPTEYQMYIYDIQNRKTYPVDFKTLTGIEDVPEFTKDYPDKKYKNTNRTGTINGPFWDSKGSKSFIEMRANDNKDRWIALLDITKGELKELDRQHDEAWIDGPGIGYFSDYDDVLGWMPDNKSVWFQSEETGYSHLYMVDIQTGKKVALTNGEYEIFNPKISNDKKYWYFSSNKEHPGEVHFYRMPLKGGTFQKITKNTGYNQVYLSPDETKLAIRYSFSNKPWEIYLMNNPLHSGKDESMVQITKSLTPDFEAYEWKVPENITFAANDGKTVHARLYKPDLQIANKAAVIFVHGAGYLQNAHKWWSSYFREYMFHNLLVDNGYTVLDIDYRGSAGYGREWRTGIYRHMGGKDLSDQVDGAAYLVKEHGIDKERIGIYGGSYGGFITIMALFKNPETFKAGAAIRSVTDWAHYNHGYTANILNTPVTDSLAYRRSSPIYFAEGLKGHLLMLHGMVDDNVHFQDVVRLSERLIELGKENWDLAIYPVERHAFIEPTSWTDEYTRIFKFFERNLLYK